MIYSSTLNRASVMAQIIAERCGVRHLKDSRLNELSFGDWEGLTFAEITEKYNVQWRRWQCDFENVSPPNGERMKDLQERTLSFLDSMAEDEENRTLAIVSHAGAIKVILIHALNTTVKSFWRLKIDPGSISMVKYLACGPLVTSINQTTHLEKAISDG
jgi:broad specificity phosphatase PhoE